MGKQVLIVNYEPKSLARLNKIVSDLGLESVTAKNGQEALDIVTDSVPDLVIIDPMLPKVSGFEVAQQLHEAHRDIPVIMVTSVYKGNRYRNEAITKYGVREYVEEPYQEDQLRGLIRKHLGMDQPAKPKKPKKASTKRRLEEILEETISGGLPSGTGVTRPVKKKSTDEPVLTSEDIFSDVIADVEAAPVESRDSVEAAVEEKLEQTLSGLKMPARKKGRKPEKPSVETAMTEQSDTGKEASAHEEPGGKTPEVERKEAEVQSTAPKPRKQQAPASPKPSEGIEYGSYVLLEKVATGGMAELFKAKRRGVQGFQKIVAIKRILSHLVDNEEFVTMFIDEAKLAAQLNHPNIAQIYDLGKIDNSFYIAMEYVEGYDLRNILKECRRKGIKIPEPLVLFIASKVLSALDYAHRKKGLDMKDLKIVHRDISPQNILISKGGDVKLVDFGIAKAATKASQTQAGALKGKLLYMSPEQAYGKQIDNRSDLFSLGSVVYEALTGKKCFLADNEISILERVRKVQYVPIREVDPDVSIDTETIVSRALAKDLDERFQSAKEMEAEIHDYMESLPFAISERVLARFINALYEGDLSVIKELEAKYSPVQDSHTPAVADSAATVRMESVPADQGPESEPGQARDEEILVTEGDLAQEASTSTKSETGTMIMPDLEKVEQEEEEMLEQMASGGSGSRVGMVVAFVVVAVVLGALGYYWWKNKQRVTAPVQQVQQAAPAVQQPETGSVPEAASDAIQPGVTSGTETPPAGEATGGEVQPEDLGLGIDREKLVQQLLEKKLAEQEALLKQQAAPELPATPPSARVEQSSPKPVVTTARATETKPVPTRPQQASTPVAVTPRQDQGASPAPAGAESAPTPVPDQSEAKPAGPPVEEPAAMPQASPSSEPVSPTPAKTEPVKAPVEAKPEPAPTPVPQVPQVKEGDLVPLVEGEVIFPKAVKKVMPRVTPLARKRKVHGTIVAQVLVDENGKVVEARIIRNIPGRHGLDKEVMRALKQWKFTPAIKQGVRVKVYYTQAFTF